MAPTTFDPTVKALVEADPASWPAFLGGPTGRTEVIDADIATVSGAADKVLRVGAATPYLLHLEFVAGHDAAMLPRTLLTRHALFHDRHGLRVRSAVVLLRPEANSPQLTGTYECDFPDEDSYLVFRYQVVRVWQLPPEALLRGGLALLPLAPISAVTEAQLPGIIEQMKQRLSSQRSRRQAPLVWAATYLLLGLRYSPELATQLFRQVTTMRESSTYQAILQEGREEGLAKGAALARRLLRILGEHRFGPADAATVAALDAITDLAQLEALGQRLDSVHSWQELLGTPTPAPRRRRRRPTP